MSYKWKLLEKERGKTRRKKKGERDTHWEEESLKAGPRNLWEAPGPGGRARSPGLLIWAPLVTSPMWLRLLPAGWPCSECAYPKRERWRVSAPNDPEGGHMPLDDLVPEDPTGPFLRSLLAEATPSPSRFSGWGRRAHLTTYDHLNFLSFQLRCEGSLVRTADFL